MLFLQFPIFKNLIKYCIFLLWLLIAVWGSLAIFYQSSKSHLLAIILSIVWLAISMALMFLLRQKTPIVRFMLFLPLFLILLIWWQTIKPQVNEVWQPQVGRQTTGDITGNTLTLHNVRNFIWHSQIDFDTNWETRHYDLNQLNSVDVITSFWSNPNIAHVMLSFGFSNGDFVVYNVGVRRAVNQKYSALSSLFKNFQLSIIATDERDAIAVRANFRNEQLYIYKINMKPQTMRALLLSYVKQSNQLAQAPEFYNTITANCNTIIYKMMQKITAGYPLDYRLIVTGRLPSYIQQHGGLQPDYSLEQLKQLGYINQRSQNAPWLNGQITTKYSQLIRQGVPGW